MWLKTIHLKNIKSFADSGEINLSKGINVFVGANNSGKSAILRSAYGLQGPEHQNNTAQQFIIQGARANSEQSELRLVLAEPEKIYFPFIHENFDMRTWQPEFYFKGSSNSFSAVMRKNNPGTETGPCTLPVCNQREPHHFIYPYFSRRKPAEFNLNVNNGNQQVVEEAFANLPSKIDRLSNPHHPAHKIFNEICSHALGLQLSAVAHQHGKQAGLTLADGNFIPVDRMGEGTLGILAMLSHLCIAKKKLFLIEEPENDIHPKALKPLLEYIITRAEENQFIISTHSNIVLKVLGSAPAARVFAVQMQLEDSSNIPTSTCKLLGDAPEERLRVLEGLGYEPSDLYMFDAYLLLEESTAERLIRDFIIPHIFPKLQGRLRTIAAGGISDVEPRFNDFYRLFVFLHTAPHYQNRAWVAVDAGPEGEKVVTKLKDRFKAWFPSRFRCFKALKFEDYYPEQFKTEVDRVFAIQDKRERQEQKGQLAVQVLNWCVDNKREAIKWFRTSATDVLAILSEIQNEIMLPKVATEKTRTY